VTDYRAVLERGLQGRYTFERELGRGGMATVWLARDLRYERPVALKVLHAGLASSLGPERFEREIRLAARLQHPHILSVYDSGAAGSGPGEAGGGGEADVLWFTMPFVEGESLRDRLRRAGPLPLSEALRITREAAQALQYAHDHGVIHRDVKPENILLTRDGSTLVADFGVAQTQGGDHRLTTIRMVVGTPSYMSPEQATASPHVDGRSDVYALGCVLHEMLTGRPTFTGASAQAVIAQQLSADPPPLPGVPEGVRSAVAKALAKDPAQRFTTAAEFATALAQPESGPSRARFTGRRAALLLALLGGSAVATYYVWREVPDLPRGGTGFHHAVASGFDRKLTQLTVEAGVEEWPVWSPDQQRLGYVGEANGYKQLFLRNVASGGDRRLTRGSKDDIQPAWSPDGSRLAFVRAKTGSGKLQPGDIYGWYSEGDIWTIDPATGEEARLVSDAFGPVYSPDGTRLAFDAPWAGPERIWIADATGRNPRQLTSDSSEAVAHTEASWSPDGARSCSAESRRSAPTSWSSTSGPERWPG